jgi:hypothetical protein
VGDSIQPLNLQMSIFQHFGGCRKICCPKSLCAIAIIDGFRTVIHHQKTVITGKKALKIVSSRHGSLLIKPILTVTQSCTNGNFLNNIIRTTVRTGQRFIFPTVRLYCTHFYFRALLPDSSSTSVSLLLFSLIKISHFIYIVAIARRRCPSHQHQQQR